MGVSERRSETRWRWLAAAAAVTALAAAGALYVRARTPEAAPARARDPGLAVLLAIRVLEMQPDTRLTREQIAEILPFLKALKDVPPSDAEAAAVIARRIRQAFTLAQRAALEEARRRAAARGAAPDGPADGGRSAPGAPGGGAPGSGVQGGGAPGEGTPGEGAAGGGFARGAGSEEQRARIRARLFERMIRYLERRMQ